MVLSVHPKSRILCLCFEDLHDHDLKTTRLASSIELAIAMLHAVKLGPTVACHLLCMQIYKIRGVADSHHGASMQT